MLRIRSSGRHLATLVTALVLVIVAVGLLALDSYLSDHRDDRGYEWVSNAVTQPVAIFAVMALAAGIVLLFAGLLLRSRVV